MPTVTQLPMEGAVAGASLTASIFWSPRPQMFSYALTGAVLYILFLRRFRGIDALWSIPLVMLVWANLHGGFAIGFLLIGAVLVGEIFGKQVDQLLADEFRRQTRIAPESLAWLSLHETLEVAHADASGALAGLVPPHAVTAAIPCPSRSTAAGCTSCPPASASCWQ